MTSITSVNLLVSFAYKNTEMWKWNEILNEDSYNQLGMLEQTCGTVSSFFWALAQPADLFQ